MSGPGPLVDASVFLMPRFQGYCKHCKYGEALHAPGNEACPTGRQQCFEPMPQDDYDAWKKWTR